MSPYLPSPTHSFTIPSIYDGIQIACRIYLPQEILHGKHVSQWCTRGAIVAHPYAPLGGCYDDPVVGFIGKELLEAGYVVGTFNFRGAGDSEGRTSWTAKPELADYASFYGFMILYLRFLKLKVSSPEPVRSAEDDLVEETTAMHIILGGYSYGSLVASHLPKVDMIVDLFSGSACGTSMHAIFLSANTVCSWSEDAMSTRTISSPNSISYHVPSMKEAFERSKATVSYLLVSPLLPPVNLFLTLFSNLSLEVGSSPSGKGKQIPCPQANVQLCVHQTLAIYGDQDTFTSASKLRKWSNELSVEPQSQFHSVEIEGAGHFWREDGVELQARESLRVWLRQMQA